MLEVNDLSVNYQSAEMAICELLSQQSVTAGHMTESWDIDCAPWWWCKFGKYRCDDDGITEIIDTVDDHHEIDEDRDSVLNDTKTDDDHDGILDMQILMILMEME